MAVTSVIVHVYNQFVFFYHNVSDNYTAVCCCHHYGRLILPVTCFQVSRDFLVT